jgi:hypothetical protein
MAKNSRFDVKTYDRDEFVRLTNKMRTWLRSIARRRSSGTVTADDVHTYLDRQGIRPQQVRTRLSFINAVLRQPDFEYAGSTKSNRPVARGRAITEWMVS